MTALGRYAGLLGAGDFSELYLEDASSLSLRWEDGRLEWSNRSAESGAGLRFLSGRETRFGHADLSAPFRPGAFGDDDERLRLLRRDVAVGLASSPVRPIGSATERRHPVETAPDSVPIDRKIELLRRVDAAARSNPHVRQVVVSYGERLKRVAVLNSDGEAFDERRTYVVMSVLVTAERDGVLQTGYETGGGLAGWELLDGGKAERIADVAARRAAAKLDAPPAPAGEMTVVIAAEAGGTLIHEAVGHSLEADAVLEGTSPPYQGRLGTAVASGKLSVADDPTLPGMRGSYFFDDEGTPAERTLLVENGVLRDYLYDRRAARRAGRASNGHGRRESYAHPPIPRMSNTIILPGPDNPDAIRRELVDGLLVTRMGGGQVNTTTGDFVFEVEEGFEVRAGERRLVRGATLLGNGPAVLRSIDRVGSDFGVGIGTCGKEGQGVPVSDGIPTIRIPRLVVGGTR